MHPNRYSTAISLLLVSCFVFIVLLKTLSPSVHTGDSGELIVSAWSLGIAHNPGYPVYSLLGRALGFCGLGNPAFRVNLLSALSVALASVFAFLALFKLFDRILVAATGSVLLPLSTTVWWQATDAEVYALYLLSLSVLAYILTMFHVEHDVRWLYCASFILGLSLGNHVSLVMMLPAILCLLWGDRSLCNLRVVFVCLLLITLGLCSYVYLPVRASTNPAINWSDPDDIGAFLYHIGAAEHRGKALLTPGYQEPFARFTSILSMVAWQYWFASPIVLFLAAWGLVTLRRRKGLMAAAALAIALNIIYVEFINVVPLQATGFGYPSYVVIVLLFAAGFSKLAGKRPRVAVIAAAALLALSIAGNYYPNDRSSDRIAYHYADNLLGPVPEGSAILVKGDNQIFTSLYLHAVEGFRPDLSLYDAYGDLALDLRSFAGFRDAERSLPAAQVCEVHPACFLGTAPDRYYGEWAKNAQLAGILHAIGGRPGSAESASFWGLYDLQGVDDPHVFKRIMSQEIAASYHFYRAKYYIERNDKAGWLKHLRLASRAGEQVHFVRAKVADEYAQAGMMNEALREFEAARRLNPNDADIHNQLGVLYRKLGMADDAVNAFEAALRLQPNESDYAFNLGNALTAAGRLDEAVKLYERALEGASNPAEVYNNLGQALKKKNDFAGAVEQFRKSIAAQEDYLAPRVNLGVTYVAMGDYDQAVAEYEAALAINPDSSELHNNLGAVYRRKRQPEPALEQFQKALEINPRFLAARVNLASTYAQMKQYPQAIANYKAALEIDPNYVDTHYNLGWVYMNQNEPALARQAWKKVLELAPDSPQARSVKATLSRQPLQAD